MNDSYLQIFTHPSPCTGNQLLSHHVVHTSPPGISCRCGVSETSITCWRLMCCGPAFEGRHQLVLPLWECCHVHRTSLRRGVWLFAGGLDIFYLQFVPCGTVPESELLSHIYELHICGYIRYSDLWVNDSDVAIFFIDSTTQMSCRAVCLGGIPCAGPMAVLARVYRPRVDSCRSHMIQMAIKRLQLDFDSSSVYYIKIAFR